MILSPKLMDVIQKKKSLCDHVFRVLFLKDYRMEKSKRICNGNKNNDIVHYFRKLNDLTSGF